MLKKKLDYKLVNLALIVFIGYLVFGTKEFWFDIINTILKIVFPFIVAFSLAYGLNPLANFFQSKKIPKGISIIIVVVIVIGTLALSIGLIIPIVFGQLSSLFNGIITFVKDISNDYDLNLGPLQESLTETFNNIIKSISTSATDGAMSAINMSFGVISTAFISFSSAIYFLIDMDKIRETVKKHSKKRSMKQYHYLKEIDVQMDNYISGFLKIVVISFFEYTFAFIIIGHPNALLLGFLAAVASFIPYFGGMAVNAIAAITAFVISPALFVKTVIVFFILSLLDSYLISPKVYGKTNNIHPLVVIISVFAGGILFGLLGIVISLPVAIILLTTYKFFEDDITDVLNDKKEVVGKK